MTGIPDTRHLDFSPDVDDTNSYKTNSPQADPNGSGSPPAKSAAGSITGVGLVLGGIGLMVAAFGGVLSTIDATGIVDENVEWWRFVVAVVSAVMTAVGTDVLLRTWDAFPRGWQVTLAVLVGLITIVPAAWLLLNRPNQEFVQGEISEDTPFAKRTLLSGENGSRYFITLDTVPGLTAKFSIRGAGQEIAGIASDGRVVAEGVLSGDATWTVVITPLQGSGKYLLYVDSVEPERMSVGEEVQARSFEPGRARSSFVFDLHPASGGKAEVFVQVRAAVDDESNPGWTLRSSQGITIDHKVVEDKSKPFTVDQSTFTKVLPGEYVLDVFGTVGQQFELIVNDRDPDNPSQPAPEPTPGGLVAIPAGVEFQAPGSDVVTALVGAGFVVQNVPVCSNSFAAADPPIPVGATRQIVKSGAATIAEEVEILGDNGLNSANLGEGDTLPRGTRLDVKTFNGLPCE